MNQILLCIGNPSGQYGAILPAQDYLLCPAGIHKKELGQYPAILASHLVNPIFIFLFSKRVQFMVKCVGHLPATLGDTSIKQTCREFLAKKNKSALGASSLMWHESLQGNWSGNQGTFS